MKKITFALLLFSASLFSQNPAAESLGFGLKLYYPFNASADDFGGNDYHGDPSQIVYVTDRFGNPNGAAYFNGVDTYVNFPNIEDLKASFPVSFSFWIKYDDMNYQKHAVFNTSFENNHCTGVWFNSEADTGRYAVNYGDGSYAYAPWTRNTYVSNTQIETSQWHHIGIVLISNSMMYIFVDGVEAGGTHSGSGGDLAYSVFPGSLGRHDRNLDLPADYFKGRIDDFAYWGNHALNQTEITALKNNSVSLVNIALNVPTVKTTDFSVYPNPVNDKLHIDSPTEIGKVVLYNNLGQEFYSGSGKIIDVTNLQSGIYFLKTDNPNLPIKKIIVK